MFIFFDFDFDTETFLQLTQLPYCEPYVQRLVCELQSTADSNILQYQYLNIFPIWFLWLWLWVYKLLKVIKTYIH